MNDRQRLKIEIAAFAKLGADAQRITIADALSDIHTYFQNAGSDICILGDGGLFANAGALYQFYRYRKEEIPSRVEALRKVFPAARDFDFVTAAFTATSYGSLASLPAKSSEAGNSRERPKREAERVIASDIEDESYGVDTSVTPSLSAMDA